MIIEEFTYFLSHGMIQRKEHSVYIPITPVTLRGGSCNVFQKHSISSAKKKKMIKINFADLIEVPKNQSFPCHGTLYCGFLIT